MTELQKRLAVSVVFIPLVLGAMYVGGIFLNIVFTLVAFLCSSEYLALLRATPFKPGWHWLPLYLTAFLALVFLPGWDLVVLWLLLLGVILDGIFKWDSQASLPRAALLFFGGIYTAFLPAMIVRLGHWQQQPKLLFWLVILIWSADSLAYFVGTGWGKRRGLFAMSPKKSLEGFLAGALAPFIIVIILYLTGMVSDLAVLLLTAFAAGIAGQFGDLAESMLKRFCGAKDSSRLIPGHGGILDRSDSILLAGSFLYCALTILDKVR